MSLSLLILAAGMGSRFGGLKQIMPVGKNGEIIMDYSIYDARQAGFSRVALVIRREHEASFREIFDDRYADDVRIDYVFQDLNDLPGSHSLPAGRAKPWGTGHAVWAARELISEPFAMINADDFYGAESFRVIADFLRARHAKPQTMQFCLAGYELAKTLSEHGSVSRGVCETDAQNELTRIRELTKIRREYGQIFNEGQGARLPVADRPEYLRGDEKVSMNCFGFTPELFQPLGELFGEFLETNGASAASEFYMPVALDMLMSRRQATVKVLPTTAQWFGMTYKEDRPAVAVGIAQLGYPKIIKER
ncbi:nucleotidyltransferase [Planctomycetales bacterium]|nr:nucleotidyltransferase [Planctomycetales bacterium]